MSLDVRKFRAVSAVKNDTDLVQMGLFAAATDPSRTLFLPGRDYILNQPLVKPVGVTLFGEGTTRLLPSPDFDLTFNIDGSPPGLIQSVCYATTKIGKRFDEWDHGGVVRDIAFVNAGVKTNALCLCQSGENSLVEGVTFYGFETGLYATGSNAALGLRRLVFNYSKQNALKFCRHPQYPSLGSGGTVRIDMVSGDGNGPAFFHIEGSHNITVTTLKYEAAPTPDCCVVRFAVDPWIVSSNQTWGNRGPGDKPVFTLLGGSIDPGAMDTAVRIETTGATDPRNFTTPYVAFMGVKCLSKKWLYDGTRNRVIGDWDATGLWHGIGSFMIYDADIDGRLFEWAAYQQNGR